MSIENEIELTWCELIYYLDYLNLNDQPIIRIHF